MPTVLEGSRDSSFRIFCPEHFYHSRGGKLEALLPALNRECEDHDIVIGRNFEIGQAIGYFHPRGGCYVLEKYLLSRKGYWEKSGVAYRRIFKSYEPVVVKLSPRKAFDPMLHSIFPIMDYTEIRKLLKPEDGMRRVLKRAADELELTALRLYDALREIGVSSSAIGVTGSILAGIHSISISDIDMTVRGCRNVQALMEASPILSFERKELDLWAQRNSERLSLSKDLLKDMYDERRRGVFEGKRVSLILLSSREEVGNYQVIEGKSVGSAAILAELQPSSCYSYLYPSIHEIRILRKIEGASEIEDGMRGRVISYEGLYTNAMNRGGKAIVRGKAFLSEREKMVDLIVGIREEETFVKRVMG
ncbi:MAG: hypothetical protein QXK13_06690 [Fervidicoccaceae archaeon]